MEAYQAAERAFLQRNFKKGDPATEPGTHGAYGIVGRAVDSIVQAQPSFSVMWRRSFRALMNRTSHEEVAEEYE